MEPDVGQYLNGRPAERLRDLKKSVRFAREERSALTLKTQEYFEFDPSPPYLVKDLILDFFWTPFLCSV